MSMSKAHQRQNCQLPQNCKPTTNIQCHKLVIGHTCNSTSPELELAQHELYWASTGKRLARHHLALCGEGRKFLSLKQLSSFLRFFRVGKMCFFTERCNFSNQNRGEALVSVRDLFLDPMDTKKCG